MFIGVPGSGKSFFARQLAEQIHGVRMSGDAMRLAIFGSLEAISDVYHSPDRQRVNTYTFGAIDYVTDQLLTSGVSVIIDAIHSKRSDRKKQEEIARRHGALPVLVHIKTSYETALARGQSRAALADQRQFDEAKMREVIAQFESSLEPVVAGENLIEISGEISFEEQLVQFSQAIERL